MNSDEPTNTIDAAPDESPAAPPEPTAPSEPAAPPDELAALRKELDDLRGKHLRLQAELQNQQKRAQREQFEAVRFAEATLARELLVVLDDLERTQEAARTANNTQAVADGVRIVYEHFVKILRDHRIAPIEAVGKPFDPSFHEAIMQQPSADHPAGTIIQEIARGYTMHERVLRHSRVIVSSGPPAEEKDKEPEH